MKKEKMAQFVGKNVEITFLDGRVEKGVLGYTKEFSAEYGWRKPCYFTINDTDFKVSHVKSIVTE